VRCFGDAVYSAPFTDVCEKNPLQ